MFPEIINEYVKNLTYLYCKI